VLLLLLLLGESDAKLLADNALAYGVVSEGKACCAVGCCGILLLWWWWWWWWLPALEYSL
jgi:hypothetical protein